MTPREALEFIEPDIRCDGRYPEAMAVLRALVERHEGLRLTEYEKGAIASWRMFAGNSEPWHMVLAVLDRAYGEPKP